MGEKDLLEMLAAEADRRTTAIIDGMKELAGSTEARPERIEALRVEAHGLKGAASVVGQERLAALAARVEDVLAERVEDGTLDPALSVRIGAAAAALREGARAAADGSGEPPEVAASITSLGG